MGIRVANSSCVMSHQIWNAFASNGNFDNFAQFELSFDFVDSMGCETSLNVVQQTESFVGLFDANNVHESGRITHLRANFSVNFD